MNENEAEFFANVSWPGALLCLGIVAAVCIVAFVYFRSFK